MTAGSGGGRVGAFFDLDGVVLRTTTGKALVRDVIRLRSLEFRNLAAIVVGGLLYEAGVRAPFSTHRVVGHAIAGMSVDEVAEIARSLARRLLAEFSNPDVLQCLQRHHSAGHLTVLATAAPAPIAEAIGAHLGVARTLSTRYMVMDDRYTGQLAGRALVAREKQRSVEACAQAESVDLDGAFMYADDYADRFLLQRVGQPRVIDPDRRLERLAMSRDWAVYRHPGEILP